jgi:hypothetical protein
MTDVVRQGIEKLEATFKLKVLAFIVTKVLTVFVTEACKQNFRHS